MSGAAAVTLLYAGQFLDVLSHLPAIAWGLVRAPLSLSVALGLILYAFTRGEPGALMGALAVSAFVVIVLAFPAALAWMEAASGKPPGRPSGLWLAFRGPLPFEGVISGVTTFLAALPALAVAAWIVHPILNPTAPEKPEAD